MPEILRLDPNLYSLRHIRVGNPPNNTGTALMGVLPNASPVVVLGKSTSFEQLPISDLISSPDVVSGTSTARLGDSGTWQAQFPNKPASDGVSWLARFTSWGRGDWVEVRRGSGALEFVGCIETDTPDYESVTIAGHDGMWCLKSQYEREWQCLQAPRDVMNHASKVAIPLLIDTFLDSSISSSWTPAASGPGASYSISTTTGLTLTAASDSASASITSVASLPADAHSKWLLSVTANVTFFQTMGGGFTITVGGVAFAIFGTLGAPQAYINYTNTGAVLPAITGPVALVVECDGRWIRAYFNGQLVGYTNPSTVGTVEINAEGAIVSLTNFVIEEWQPFLMVGTDQGDYVLPGTAQTFPNGGLHARYYNDVAIEGVGATQYLAQVLSPAKDNPASGQPAPYDVIEPSLSGLQSPGSHVTTGFAATNWSAKYFGAVWLPLAQGNVPMAVGAFTGAGVRVWIGNSQYGTQLVDEWNTTGGVYSFTVTAANYANGSGTILSGWYPVVVEYAAVTATDGPSLYFGVPSGANVPFAWTDPGGTAFTAGESAVLVPSTSLSPLGCVDQRYQGVSYFDMYQQTGQAYGYEFACEPKSLESGSFPGLLVPRIREGHDTDEVLQADTSDKVSPVVNYKNQFDATDQCSSVNAIGAGINDGQGSQLQVQVFALANMASNLFDMQGWIDASDVSYLALLAQRAASQLELQEAPWQNLTGDPRGTDRLADTFPVSGVLSEFHWRPGDGVRFYLPDVGVEDTIPRQITQVTRTWGPTGRTSSTMQSEITGNALMQQASGASGPLSNASKKKG